MPFYTDWLSVSFILQLVSHSIHLHTAVVPMCLPSGPRSTTCYVHAQPRTLDAVSGPLQSSHCLHLNPTMTGQARPCHVVVLLQAQKLSSTTSPAVLTHPSRQASLLAGEGTARYFTFYISSGATPRYQSSKRACPYTANHAERKDARRRNGACAAGLVFLAEIDVTGFIERTAI